MASDDKLISLSERPVPVYIENKKKIRDLAVQSKLSGENLVFAVTEQKYYLYEDLPAAYAYRTVSYENSKITYSRNIYLKNKEA